MAFFSPLSVLCLLNSDTNRNFKIDMSTVICLWWVIFGPEPFRVVTVPIHNKFCQSLLRCSHFERDRQSIKSESESATSPCATLASICIRDISTKKQKRVVLPMSHFAFGSFHPELPWTVSPVGCFNPSMVGYLIIIIRRRIVFIYRGLHI